MQVEFSIELGPEAPALELPWASPDGQRYLDLRARPELLLEVAETRDNRPLGEFLAAMNAPHSRFLTAKCDTWLSDEMGEEEKIFGAGMKFGSYVDLVFARREARQSIEAHQEFGQALCRLLGKAPEMAAAAEFILRRCYVHPEAEKAGRAPAPEEDSMEAYCLSFYLSGYGDDEAEARRRWMIGLKLVENAILQLAAAKREP